MISSIITGARGAGVASGSVLDDIDGDG